ncbi:MAG: hypothetical protein JSW71_10225 [Gemmatimonadota bacterium]|nr:MAG: hypothetical protein JSW71_10225 [Gemmatimonadota bacterium]
MALTIAVHGLPEGSIDLGGLKVVFGTITFDASYPTGGEALVPGDFGFVREIYALFVDAGGVVCKYDAANDTLMAYWCDYDAVADGVLIEVGNTEDISGLGALRFLAIGW